MTQPKITTKTFYLLRVKIMFNEFKVFLNQVPLEYTYIKYITHFSTPLHNRAPPWTLKNVFIKILLFNAHIFLVKFDRIENNMK